MRHAARLLLEFKDIGKLWSYVPKAGLEPARYSAQHFKCCVSAYSTTRAYKRESGFVTCVRPYTYRILSLIAGSRLLISLKVRTYRSRHTTSFRVARRSLYTAYFRKRSTDDFYLYPASAQRGGSVVRLRGLLGSDS